MPASDLPRGRGSQGRSDPGRPRLACGDLRQPVECRVGRVAGPHGKLDLGVMVKVTGELNSAIGVFEQDRLEPADAVVVDQPGAIGVDEL